MRNVFHKVFEIWCCFNLHIKSDCLTVSLSLANILVMNEHCTPLKGDNDILNYDMVAHIVL